MDKMDYCPYCMSPVEPDAPCPSCGLTAGAYAPSPHHLPPGTVLRERYLIGRVLGEGGFGITYIGCDLRLELKVAIKEYFPTDRANRVSAASQEVSSYSGAAGERYESGKTRFLQEARTMAKMDKQPVIVSVRDFFELNNTAYIVMEYVEGTTFKDLVDQRGGRIPAGELLHTMEPLFSALEAMHRRGLIHRDISPENLMLENGDVRLLDFGCARESAGGEATMTIALKHGYAPVEQYQNKGQGPWTDVYALSATIYYCLTGHKPPQSMDRLVEDELVLPRKLGVDLTQRQERALVYGMGVRPRRRFQSVEELHAALYEGILPEGLELPDLPATGEREPEPTGVIGPGPIGVTQPGPVPAEEPEAAADTRTQTAEQTQTQPQPEPAPGTEPEWLAWLKAHRQIAAGIGAAAVLLIALLVWRPWAGTPFSADDPDPSPTVEPSGAAETRPPEESGAPGDQVEQADSETTFRLLLENDKVGTIIVKEGNWLNVSASTTLNKTLRVEAGAGVGFNRGLTVAEGGRLETAGSVDSPVLLRTMDGGTISVESGGFLGSDMFWLEGGDLTCAPDGDIDVFGPDSNPVRDTLNGWELTHYLVLDEEALFAGAVHVGSEEEFARHREGKTPIVIDRDITFTNCYWVRVPVLIPEGVTVDAPCPDPGRDEGNCTLEMDCGTKLVNHGTIKGRLALHGNDGAYAPAYFVNFGTMDASLWTELSSIINLGDMTTREIMQGTALANLGSITLDGPLEVSGNWSSNGGIITAARDGGLTIYGGTGWNNFGQLEVEDGGRFENYAVFNQNSSVLRVHSGGALVNHGQIWVNSFNALIAERGAAEMSNHGVVLSEHYGMSQIDWNPDAGGHILIISAEEGSSRRVRYVSTESELRAALEDNWCHVVIWNGHQDGNKININGGPLTVTKGLILQGDSAHMVDVNSGGITVTGENAFLIAESIDFHGYGLTVEYRGTTVINNGDPINLGRLGVSGGGLACFSTQLNMESGVVNVSDGGRVVDTGGGRWENCSVRIGAGGDLSTYSGLQLIRCDVVNDGGFDSYFAYLYQEDGSFVNNGWAEFAGWYMINLNGNVSNHGEMQLGGSHRIGGTLVNEADGSINLDWEDCPLRVAGGRLENRGRIRAARGSYVETIEGGVFTGNQVIFD